LHPDVIRDFGCWHAFGRLLCIENMDSRKALGRTAQELASVFDRLPDASLCFDFGHARQVDSTLATARAILRRHGDRMIEMHLSEVDGRWRHHPLSISTVLALQQVEHLMTPCPVILESTVTPMQIGAEVRLASSAFHIAAA
jgi:hypothetical protein